MKEALYVKEGRNRFNLPYDSILFIEKYAGKVIIYTAEREYRMYAAFRELMDELDQRFFSPHKSYIFNLDYILEINGESVIIVHGYCVKLGEKCMRRLRKKMDEIFVKKRRKPLQTLGLYSILFVGVA